MARVGPTPNTTARAAARAPGSGPCSCPPRTGRTTQTDGLGPRPRPPDPRSLRPGSVAELVEQGLALALAQATHPAAGRDVELVHQLGGPHLAHPGQGLQQR